MSKDNRDTSIYEIDPYDDEIISSRRSCRDFDNIDI